MGQGLKTGIADNTMRKIESDVFSKDIAYAVGQYCIYNNTLYKFIAEKLAGEWDESKVTPTSVTEEMLVLSNRVGFDTKLVDGVPFWSERGADTWSPFKSSGEGLNVTEFELSWSNIGSYMQYYAGKFDVYTDYVSEGYRVMPFTFHEKDTGVAYRYNINDITQDWDEGMTVPGTNYLTTILDFSMDFFENNDAGGYVVTFVGNAAFMDGIVVEKLITEYNWPENGLAGNKYVKVPLNTELTMLTCFIPNTTYGITGSGIHVSFYGNLGKSLNMGKQSVFCVMGAIK